MQNKKKLRISAAIVLLSVPLAVTLTHHKNVSASEEKTALDFKKVILLDSEYDYMCNYDLNNDNNIDVFDLMRCKREELKPSVQITDTTTVPPVTEFTGSVSTNVPETTPAEITTVPDITTVPETTTVSETTTIPETTTVTTTTAPPETTTVTTTTTPPPATTPVTTVTVTNPPPVVTTMPQRKIISNVKSILQSPELPTGCEATGLTIAIRWYGYDVDKMSIAKTFMPQMTLRYSNGKLIGPDFITTFAGDPTSNTLSYGCYIPCLMTTANSYFSSVGSNYRTKNLSGTSLRDLFKYVADNTPVVLISTPELMTPRSGDSWYTPDGRYVTWQRGHHCMVLIGYDLNRGKVYCADPMKKKGVVEYDMGKFEEIYNLKGKNAMIIDTGSSKPAKRTAAVGDTIRYVGYLHTASTGGTERYVDSNLYTVTNILSDTSLPYRVCLGNIGWVSYDALYENIASYGSSVQTDPSSGVISTGVYNIKNKQSSKYLNVDYGIDENGTNVYQWSRDGSTEQKFKINNDGPYNRMFSMCSSSGTDKLVTASSVSENANVYQYQSIDRTKQEWEFKWLSGNEYVIALRSDPSLVLTAYGCENGSGGGTSSSSAGNVYVSKYVPGSSAQIWCIER